MEIAELEGKKVVLTNHALCQFSDRYAQLNEDQAPLEPIRVIATLFKEADEKKLSKMARLKRLLNNRGVDARYFIFKNWRFVLVENDESFSVVTIERNKFAA